MCLGAPYLCGSDLNTAAGCLCGHVQVLSARTISCKILQAQGRIIWFLVLSHCYLTEMDPATDVLVFYPYGLLIQVGSKEWMGSVNPQFVSLGI
jgi:hypothetical protein